MLHRKEAGNAQGWSGELVQALAKAEPRWLVGVGERRVVWRRQRVAAGTG
jgi:hypothetical protein